MCTAVVRAHQQATNQIKQKTKLLAALYISTTVRGAVNGPKYSGALGEKGAMGAYRCNCCHNLNI